MGLIARPVRGRVTPVTARVVPVHAWGRTGCLKCRGEPHTGPGGTCVGGIGRNLLHERIDIANRRVTHHEIIGPSHQ